MGIQVSELARAEFMGILGCIASVKGKVVHLIGCFYPISKVVPIVFILKSQNKVEGTYRRGVL